MVAEGTATKGASWRSPGTKYKRSKNAFAVTSIAFSFEARLLEISENCVILNPCTLLRYMFSIRPCVALCQHLSSPTWPLPLRWTEFLKKGGVFHQNFSQFAKEYACSLFSDMHGGLVGWVSAQEPSISFWESINYVWHQF